MKFNFNLQIKLTFVGIKRNRCPLTVSGIGSLHCRRACEHGEAQQAAGAPAGEPPAGLQAFPGTFALF